MRLLLLMTDEIKIYYVFKSEKRKALFAEYKNVLFLYFQVYLTPEYVDKGDFRG